MGHGRRRPPTTRATLRLLRSLELRDDEGRTADPVEDRGRTHTACASRNSLKGDENEAHCERRQKRRAQHKTMCKRSRRCPRGRDGSSLWRPYSPGVRQVFRLEHYDSMNYSRCPTSFPLLLPPPPKLSMIQCHHTNQSPRRLVGRAARPRQRPPAGTTTR